MKTLDSLLDHRVKHAHESALPRILVLSFVLALAALAVVAAATVLPATSAQACEPVAPKDNAPHIARPRAGTSGNDLNGGELTPGDEILWLVTVRNPGSKLTNIVIADVVPKGTTYVAGSIQGPGADDGGSTTLKWTLGSIGCGDSVTVSFRSRVDDGVTAGTLIGNQAWADSGQTPAGVSRAVTLEVSGSSVASKDAETADAPDANSSAGFFSRLFSRLLAGGLPR